MVSHHSADVEFDRITTPSGLQFLVAKAGHGPNLLFVGGTDGDLLRHDAVSPFFDELTSQFTVWSYDQRGLGSSAKPVGPYTMGDYADDARDLVVMLELGEVPVVGYSFGGMVAQEFVLRHPARVGRLGLVCTSSGGDGGSSFPVNELAGLPTPERRSRTLALWDTRRDDDWQRANPEACADWDREWTAFESLTAATEGQPMGSRAQLAARLQHDTCARLSEVRAPTLVLGGVWDGIAPIDRQLALAMRIPNSSIALLDGGHRVLWEDGRAPGIVAKWAAE
ncbi:MAG: alpha/beta hydrolase [Actinomycetota bacterium]